MCACMLSHVQFFTTPMTIAHKAPLSMRFPSQEYWSRLAFPSPGDLPNPGMDTWSPALQANSLPSEPPGKFGGSCSVVKAWNNQSPYLLYGF